MAAVKALSAERGNLRESIQQVTDATEALQQAEADHDAASNAYRAQQRAVTDLEERRDALIAEANRRPPIARVGYQERVDEFAAPLHDAKLPLANLAQAEASARAAVDAATRRLSLRQSHLLRSATAVLQAEAPAAAAIMAEHVAAAFQTIASFGPDLAYLLGAGLVSKDVLGSMPGAPRLLEIFSTEWQGFALAYRNSPWRGVPAVLANDPDAQLPSV